MKVEYLGHSCFFIEGEHTSVVTDPFGDIGFLPRRVKCEFATSSHSHFDHNNFGGVDCRVRVDQDHPHPMFTPISCYHDNSMGARRGKNTAYYFEIDGVKFLHLGDLGESFTKENAAKFKLPVDMLFIPVGGNYTIGAKEAAEYAGYIGARVTVPMHYKTKESKIDIASVSGFLAKTGEWATAPNPLEFTAATIGDMPHVVVYDFI